MQVQDGAQTRGGWVVQASPVEEHAGILMLCPLGRTKEVIVMIHRLSSMQEQGTVSAWRVMQG